MKHPNYIEYKIVSETYQFSRSHYMPLKDVGNLHKLFDDIEYAVQCYELRAENYELKRKIEDMKAGKN